MVAHTLSHRVLLKKTIIHWRKMCSDDLLAAVYSDKAASHFKFQVCQKEIVLKKLIYV